MRGAATAWAVFALLGVFSAPLLAAQATEPDPRLVPSSQGSAPTPPLPDLGGLMHLVEEHQKAAEATLRNYIYTSNVTETRLDRHGDTKKSETEQADIFYVDTVRLRRVTERDGKALTAEEQRKESERIDKEIAHAREKKSNGGRDHQDEVTFARFLELGSFSNERRVSLHGRPTIALDYTGDPKAHTRNTLEGAIREMAGTVWVDEEDVTLSRVEGRFLNNFKVGGGLLANIEKGTSFAAEMTPVNHEVWLPASFSAQGSARTLLFFNFNGRVSGTATNYRRFKTGTTILPGVQEVEDAPASAGSRSAAP